MSESPKIETSFLKQIVLVVIVASGLGAYPLMTFAADEVVAGVVAGGVLSVVNALMGYAVVQFSIGKSYTVFMQIVLGGIALRLFVMVALLLVAVGLFRFHALSLIGSLFVMYIVFLVVEVMYIHKNIQHS
ncbi:MAG: hypothetical protein WCX28_01875 [Bacteriovoracaceae bacterium]|nr:hypothetical protein [Bacteroidota bacterium]